MTDAFDVSDLDPMTVVRVRVLEGHGLRSIDGGIATAGTRIDCRVQQALDWRARGIVTIEGLAPVNVVGAASGGAPMVAGYRRGSERSARRAW